MSLAVSVWIEHRQGIMRRWFALLLLVNSFVPACKEDQACTPGKSEACVGPGGCAGAQVCDPSGEQFAACVCGSGGDGGADSADSWQIDSTVDTGNDSTIDTGNDSTIDTGNDSIADTSTDSIADTSTDSIVDTGMDSTIDSESDSSVDSSSPTDTGVATDADAGDAAPCDPVLQTGCGTGQKCIVVAPSSGDPAVNTCVTAGSVAAGGACTTDPSDNCAAGLVCLNGECRKYCDETVSTPCPANFFCDNYPIGTGSMSACIPRCDPVTQVRLYDGAAACGSPDPTAPTRGCVGTPNKGFRCQPTSSTKKHGDELVTPYLNGCAPGYQPLLHKTADPSSPFICVAFCKPGETYSTSTANAGGVAPNTCAARGATGAECRYWWYLEDTSLPKTTDSNTVGFCLDYGNYTYDHDGNSTTAPIPFPSCTTLANTDTNGDSTPDHLYWACGPLP